MKKYIFFDIDGTLTNHNPGGVILPSTHQTLRKLKENGHFVAIATGRSYSMAREMMNKAHIHHAVCCGGNGLVIDDEVVYIEPLDKEKALMIVHECMDKGIAFGVMIDDTPHIYTHNHALSDQCPELAEFAEICLIDEKEYDDFNEIHKIHIALTRDETNPLTSLQLTGLHYARYHDHSIIVEPDDKYKGIIDMLRYIGGCEEDVVVFGDGHNDISMMVQASTSIAMGNAIDELKEIATFVTKDCTDDGIAYACQHFGWI